MLVTPLQAPNANAYAERWIRTVRAECLDWLLIVGRGHLEQVLRVYVEHYNVHRPHRALGLEPPDPLANLSVVRDGPAEGCIDATGSAACSTNTIDELHERVSAPNGSCLKRAVQLTGMFTCRPCRSTTPGMCLAVPTRSC